MGGGDLKLACIVLVSLPGDRKEENNKYGLRGSKNTNSGKKRLSGSGCKYCWSMILWKIRLSEYPMLKAVKVRGREGGRKHQSKDERVGLRAARCCVCG